MVKLSRARLLQLVICAVIAGVAFWALRDIGVVDHITALEKRVGEMGNEALLFFPLLIAACNILLLPGSILMASAGLFFGLWWGVLAALAGNFIGAALAFFISRRFARNWLEPKLMSNPKLRAIDEAVDREGWKVVFFSQLHPISPSSLLNYLYGFTRIRFWPCMFWILAGQLPGILFYVYLGTVAHHGIAAIEGETEPKSADYWTWAGGLVLTLAITAVLGRVAIKVLAQAQRPDVRGSSS